MNWNVFLMVIIGLPLGAIAYHAGGEFSAWIRKRYGTRGLLALTCVQLLIAATVCAWAFAK